MNNYNPISVLSIFSRLLEKIAHDQLYAFLKEHQLTSPNQFAFQKMHSTITSLLNVTDLWYSNIDYRKLNIGVFLDLKKAFDTVDHDFLLSKLDEQCLQKSSQNMYADDTSVTYANSDSLELTRVFNTDLGNISEWMREN